MRRRASVFHLGRANIDTVVRRLRDQDVSAWPRHLQTAFALLTEKLGSEPPVARDVVVSATRAALSCAAEISNVALQEERQRIRDQCGRSFRMLANNLRLLPANLQKATTARRLGTAVFDAEVLEEVLERIVLQLAALRTNPAAKRVLKAIYADPATEPEEDLAGKRFGLVELYCALHLGERRTVESSVQTFLSSTSDPVSDRELFSFLAREIAKLPTNKASAVATTIIDYVERGATSWLENGLPATRAFHPENPHYKSSFHIFADMVLAAATEPSTSRHDTDLELIRSRTLHQHRLLPASLRSEVSAASRRQDNEWLVSDDHVKRAISKLKGNSKVSFEKTTPVTP